MSIATNSDKLNRLLNHYIQNLGGLFTGAFLNNLLNDLMANWVNHQLINMCIRLVKYFMNCVP